MCTKGAYIGTSSKSKYWQVEHYRYVKLFPLFFVYIFRGILFDADSGVISQSSLFAVEKSVFMLLNIHVHILCFSNLYYAALRGSKGAYFKTGGCSFFDFWI